VLPFLCRSSPFTNHERKKSRSASGSTTAAAKKITTVKKSTDAQLDARYFIRTEKKKHGLLYSCCKHTTDMGPADIFLSRKSVSVTAFTAFSPGGALRRSVGIPVPTLP
jgi:hypothetical protein